MNKPKQLYFIAVNYNHSSYTIDYIKSVLELNGNYDMRVIIVDNKSEADDIASLEKGIAGLSNVTLIKSDINAGYFGGLNIGLKSIADRSNAYILVGNNDLTFESNFANELFNLNYSDETLVLAPDVVTVNGFHQNPLCKERMPWIRKWGLRLYYVNYYVGRSTYFLTQKIKSVALPNKRNENQEYIYMGIGACYILTPSFFKHFELLWDDVFLWSEEALLAGQIDSVKGKMLYCPSLIVHHAENTSVSKLPGRTVYEMARKSFLKTFKYYLW